MTAEELIRKLQEVAPETEVRIATESGVYGVADVRSLGYSGGLVNIVAED
jgi:hypothetical protein